jgi:hypothetical protein
MFLIDTKKIWFLSFIIVIYFVAVWISMFYNTKKICCIMGLFKKEKKNETKCSQCGLELPTPERLEKHKKKAHGNVPEKKLDENSGSGSMW